ncbi:putative Permease of the major facilitator superfamily [Vibrio nigripulchritudo SFn27]|uniref:Putative Permease of the major facilitator superfamily n=1 Tax=Vibrio nigripulchritudo TaxID=28173 RepID=U4K5V4_9VIBR|nr:MFS transporter [Vibrio nigripulchritudo]CCN68421.1 putative Permease of the major facilitator superfamily [Vibrio nigripulchritudo SFn118]CCN84463.1 putative Permease of the major facilitator superfamily [Vibrio nigripulchritudo BLFn1]CCN86510.1 putative Permease of the major facilitator superfamily [Vibrio nigripulchritudo SFn27]CCN97053.1 putative Permease of the major facilitator superfamily [Vibrio nigripulchritudo ENn2]CCO41589.1 putative Permease of the major facilitator superfamily 
MATTENQESLFQWQRVKRFNFTIWTVLGGTLLARTTYFMAWPYLIVFLYQDYNASALEVGSMLAASAVVGVVSGLYSGYLSDKFGRKWVMISGSLIAVLAYGGIGVASEIWQFFVLLMLCGLMRSMIEAPAKAVIGDNLSDGKDRELALNIRYFVLNLGGAIGPLIGISLALAAPQKLFLVTGISYLIFALWLWLSFARFPEKRNQEDCEVPDFKATIKVIARDKIFQILLIANLTMMFVYAQLESSLPQVLVRSSVADAATLIASLVLVNTLTIIVFQFPMLKLMEKVPLFKRTQIGMVLMGVGMVGFIATPEDWAIGWGMACFIISLGEVIAFPTLSVQIDQLAPEHLRGSYFGAAALYSLGFAIAPLVGGAMLDKLDADWLWALCGLLCMIMIWLYRLVEARTVKQEDLQETLANT